VTLEAAPPSCTGWDRGTKKKKKRTRNGGFLGTPSCPSKGKEKKGGGGRLTEGLYRTFKKESHSPASALQEKKEERDQEVAWIVSKKNSCAAQCANKGKGGGKKRRKRIGEWRILEKTLSLGLQPVMGGRREGGRENSKEDLDSFHSTFFLSHLTQGQAKRGRGGERARCTSCLFIKEPASINTLLEMPPH